MGCDANGSVAERERSVYDARKSAIFRNRHDDRKRELANAVLMRPMWVQVGS